MAFWLGEGFSRVFFLFWGEGWDGDLEEFWGSFSGFKVFVGGLWEVFV